MEMMVMMMRRPLHPKPIGCDSADSSGSTANSVNRAISIMVLDAVEDVLQTHEDEESWFGHHLMIMVE